MWLLWALLLAHSSALVPCCNADKTCSFQERCEIPACSGMCHWSLTPFVDAMPLPAVLDGEKRVVLEASAFSARFHAQLPPMTAYGFAGQTPGPTIVGRPGKVLQFEVINSLPSTHALTVDTRVHGVLSKEPLLMLHLHGANVRSRYDGQPLRFIAPSKNYDALSRETRFFDNTETGTLFYHDHAHGITRLNVAMGLYGMYIVSEKPLDSSRDIPLIITALAFNATSIYYPPTPVHMYRTTHFLCNGKVQPFFRVDRARYQFRIVNLAQSHVLSLRLSPAHTLELHGKAKDSITLSMGENLDVQIDFGTVAGTELVLMNNDKPLLRFDIVGGATRRESSVVPSGPIAVRAPVDTAMLIKRTFRLGLTNAHNNSGMLRWWSINGLAFDDLTEFVQTGTREVWTFVNTANMDHPMHVHAVDMQVLERRNVNNTVLPLRDEDLGSKNTVSIAARETVSVLVDFSIAHLGRFPYHCHDLTHEDYSMMRQFLVVNQPGSCNSNGVCECGEDCVTCPKVSRFASLRLLTFENRTVR
jgi:spore coat protein A